MRRIRTYNDIFLETRKVLREAGVAAYDLEARLIVEYASGKSRAEYINTARRFPPDGKFEHRVLECLARALAGEPVAYIIGEWEFFSMPMKVSPDVLIPRADTETLAERAITLLQNSGLRQPRVLDLCCGTGCIGLAVARGVPPARVVLADISDAVLSVARANTVLNALTRRVAVVCADALKPPPALFGAFDMIVCNPPYIPTSDIAGLDASVREFEPISALDGGADGLLFYRNISSRWKSLVGGGVILFEIGVSQSGEVCDIMRENGFFDVCVTNDLAGVPRVAEGRLR